MNWLVVYYIFFKQLLVLFCTEGMGIIEQVQKQMQCLENIQKREYTNEADKI